MRPDSRLIPAHGGYRTLRSFQAAQLVYDGTVIFCDRFVQKRSRTHDQMVQAARSGVQNIAEGSSKGWNTTSLKKAVSPSGFPAKENVLRTQDGQTNLKDIKRVLWKTEYSFHVLCAWLPDALS